MQKSGSASEASYSSGTWPSGVTWTSKKIQWASKPITGAFSVTFKGNTVSSKLCLYKLLSIM